MCTAINYQPTAVANIQKINDIHVCIIEKGVFGLDTQIQCLLQDVNEFDFNLLRLRQLNN